MWAQDFLAEHTANKHILNDSWTPSGPIHIGSFRSLIIHDVLRRVLEEEKKDVTYLYGFDDYDPMDGIPTGFVGYEEHLGKPLVNIPARSSKYDNFADEFISENKHYHQVLGVRSENYRTSELYRGGKFNSAIKKVLDNAETIRQIYKEVSGSERPNDWHPVQVICPKCGKLGSTYVSAWDGKEVTFECQEGLVPWAKGCGEKGKLSPFDGRAKMHWRVEWAAKWDHFNVTIEAAGKDHASRGSSFDTGARILKDVFGKKPIAAFGHEFFLLGGKKMGSTKGMVAPSDALAVFSPEVLRFLLVRTRPNQAIEIDLSQIVPTTYDEYDRCQSSYLRLKGESRAEEHSDNMPYLEKSDQDMSDFFYYSQIDDTKVDGLKKTRFIDVVNLIQLPNMKKELDRSDVVDRLPYAKAWLEKYAPEKYRFTVLDKLPDSAAKTLTTTQKEFLAKAASVITSADPEILQENLYNLAKEMGIKSGEAFSAIYLSLIGKPYGPKAGELITSQDQEFVKERFREASK